jgi:phosphate acetyltransferase
MLQGLNKPVNDLSRGCTVINTVVITAIQAKDYKNLKKKNVLQIFIRR